MHVTPIGYDVITFTYSANFTVYSNVQVQIRNGPIHTRRFAVSFKEKENLRALWFLINVLFRDKILVLFFIQSLYFFHSAHLRNFILHTSAHHIFGWVGGGGE
jgi:hypothetical protein